MHEVNGPPPWPKRWSVAPRLVLVTLLVPALVISACGGSSGGERTGRPTAVATITILADFVRAVGREHVEVETIVHVGGDPHVYEATPSDARKVARADIVFRNGLGLERWLDELIGRSRADRPVVTLTDGLTPVVQDSGVYRGDPDPHAWMDPTLAARYVERARDALVELVPARAAVFRRNAETYLAELDSLTSRIETQLGAVPPQNRKLVTTHDAFRYFGRRFGLQVIGTIWSISTEREPSAEEIRRLVDTVRSQGVPSVFVETTINPKLMERVAADAGVRVGRPLYGDSVGAPGSGADNYIGMMRANAEAIAAGLSAPAPR